MTKVVEITGAGPQGPKGDTGAQGEVGPGVPAGGTAGQLIVKDTATDYDTSWTSTVPASTISDFDDKVDEQIDVAIALKGIVTFNRS